MHKRAGEVGLPCREDKYFHYVDNFGDDRIMYLWVEDTRLHIADIKLNHEYSIEGRKDAAIEEKE